MSHKTDITVHPREVIERILSMELVRVTERAAVSAARLRGRGDEKAADQAAVDAMRRELNKLPIDGTIVIGEGERDEAPMLFIGEKVGNGTGPKVDIAVDPLEGTTLCAKDMPGAIAVMAMAQAGSLLYAPDVYMDKIAIGPGYKKGIVDLDASPEDNIHALAKAKGVKPHEINALIMDRPRHADLIAAVRKTGASIRLITDGDVAGVIFTAPVPKPSSAIGSRMIGISRSVSGSFTNLPFSSAARGESAASTGSTPDNTASTRSLRQTPQSHSKKCGSFAAGDTKERSVV